MQGALLLDAYGRSRVEPKASMDIAAPLAGKMSDISKHCGGRTGSHEAEAELFYGGLTSGRR